MSLQGDINRYSGDIRRAISQIASRNILSLDGSVRGTKKIYGYVCAIHDDGELAGTVDVQEFEYEPGEHSIPGAGHHRGVRLSALRGNTDGVIIVPMLYSEVVIVKNPADCQEYVVMYSHAREVRMAAHSLEGDNDGKVDLGVTEVEAFTETDNGLDKDYYELEPTKNKTHTAYTATSIVDQITSPEDEIGFKQEKTVEHKIITVGDTIITIDGTNVSVTTSGKVSFKIGNTEISNEDGNIQIKTDTAKIEVGNCEIKGDDIKINGGNVTLTGGNLKTKGSCSPDMQGPYNSIKTCPFSGAPHCGSSVSGT